MNIIITSENIHVGLNQDCVYLHTKKDWIRYFRILYTIQYNNIIKSVFYFIIITTHTSRLTKYVDI